MLLTAEGMVPLMIPCLMVEDDMWVDMITFMCVGGWFVLMCFREMQLSAASFAVVWWKHEADFLFGAL